MAIEAGQQVLHYRLIEKIGEGGMGVVWKAEDTLEIAYSKKEPWIVALEIGPGFDTIRADPRFDDLLRRIGAAP